jgi:hypothetical protein
VRTRVSRDGVFDALEHYILGYRFEALLARTPHALQFEWGEQGGYHGEAVGGFDQSLHCGFSRAKTKDTVDYLKWFVLFLPPWLHGRACLSGQSQFFIQ